MARLTVERSTMWPCSMQRMIDRPVLDLQYGLADVRLALREAMLEVAIHHLADDTILLDRAGLAIHRIHGVTVAQHGDAVGDTRHLVELVRDQDRGHALGAELKQKIEQRRTVAFVEACGRLVENQ